MPDLPERRVPTYTLTIRVSLNLNADPAKSPDIQIALAQALKVIMPLIGLGTLGLLCDDSIVMLEDAAP